MHCCLFLLLPACILLLALATRLTVYLRYCGAGTQAIPAAILAATHPATTQGITAATQGNLAATLLAATLLAAILSMGEDMSAA